MCNTYQSQRIEIAPDYYIQALFGNDLLVFLEDRKVEVANCYCDVFNESWGESWTTPSAIQQLTPMLTPDTTQQPMAAFLFYKNAIVGFTWGSMVKREYLHAHMPLMPGCSADKMAIAYDVSNYWLSRVVDKDNVFVWREIGVLKAYRKNKTYALALPLFEVAKKQGVDVMLSLTSPFCSVFKILLGMGIYPIHFFVDENLTIVAGNVDFALKHMQTVSHNGDSTIDNGARMRVGHYLCSH